MDIEEVDILSEEEANTQIFDAKTLNDLPKIGHSAIGNPDSEIGIVLQHGFCGTNLEMMYLGHYFARLGMRVLLPLLPGHGQDSDALINLEHTKWIETVEQSIEYLKSEQSTREIFLIGHSLGGSIALFLENREDVTAVISLAGPVQYQLYLRILIHMVGRFHHKIGFETFNFKDERLYDHPGMENFLEQYGQIPISSLNEVFELLRKVFNRLPDLSKPVCLVYSKMDKTVPSFHVDKILKDIGSSDVELHWLSNSYHVMVVDEDRTLVAEKITGFIKRLSTKNILS